MLSHKAEGSRGFVLYQETAWSIQGSRGMPTSTVEFITYKHGIVGVRDFREKEGLCVPSKETGL